MDNVIEFKMQELTISHTVDAEGKLCIRFQGSYLGSYDDLFDAYASHLMHLAQSASTGKIREVECHIEDVSKLLSRVEQGIYRMLYDMRAHVKKTVIYASQRTAHQTRHFRLAEQFLASIQFQEGTPIELVEV